MSINKYNLDIIGNVRKLNGRDLVIFLIPFVIFLYYLFVYNPGVLTFDSYNQFHQIATGNFNNWHPFLYTFIEMLCLKLYESPATIGLLQILTFSIFWMIMCKYTRGADSSRERYLFQIIFTLIISLIPINAFYSITLWKDILFSYLMMFLCFLIYVMFDKKDVTLGFVIVLSLTMALISQLRHNGIFIIAILLVVFFIYFFVKRKSQKLHLYIPALTIIFILLFASLNVVYDVEDTKKDAVFSKTIHLLADYDLNLDLENGDRDKIHAVIDGNTIKQRYNQYYLDPIGYAANETVFDNDEGTYIGMAIKYSFENPLHFLSYLFGSSAMVWDITRDADWKGQPYYEVTQDGAKANYFKINKSSPTTSYENASMVNFGTSSFNTLDGYVDFARDNIVFDTLFNSPALYMYLAFIAMAAIYLLTRSKDILFVYLPNMLNIVIVFISTPIQDNRYLYPNLLVFYLLVLILISLWNFKDKSQPNNLSNTNQVQNNSNYGSGVKKETYEEMEARIIEEILQEMEQEKKK